MPVSIVVGQFGSEDSCAAIPDLARAGGPWTRESVGADMEAGRDRARHV